MDAIEVINKLKAALKPLADEPLKEEMPTNSRLCDLSDSNMDAVILAAREAMALEADSVVVRVQEIRDVQDRVQRVERQSVH